MDDRTTEDKWRSSGLIVASILCSALLMAFSYRHFGRGDTDAGWFALAGLPFMAATIWGCLDHDKLPRWAPYPALIYLTTMVVTMIHIWNIDHGASLMWLCVIPPFATFAIGARGGLVFSCIGMAMMLTGTVLKTHLLPEPYVIRYVCAYILVAGFVFAFERKRERVAAEVESARQRIQTLEGLLRICGWCHRQMRDDEGNWVPTEQFFQDRAPVRFSHGLCPDCAAKVMEDGSDYSLKSTG
ncbi:MAG: hypothetical protein AAF557_08015 [Pseudomonadota bacterium]